MTMYAGDELYDDDVTSGPEFRPGEILIRPDDSGWEEFDDEYYEGDDDDLSGEFSDVAQGRYDFE